MQHGYHFAVTRPERPQLASPSSLHLASYRHLDNPFVPSRTTIGQRRHDLASKPCSWSHLTCSLGTSGQLFLSLTLILLICRTRDSFGPCDSPAAASVCKWPLTPCSAYNWLSHPSVSWGPKLSQSIDCMSRAHLLSWISCKMSMFNHLVSS